MSITFLVEIHNAPAKLVKSIVFERAFDAGIDKLVEDYHTDNDREGTEIQWYFCKGPKGSKKDRIEIAFLKGDGQVDFDDLEKKLMSEIVFLLEEIVNENSDDKFEAEELI